MIVSIVKASRPVSWINTAYPFAAGYLMVERHVDALLIVGTLFFLIPYNLLMYGVNDVFDYESDLLNPRKGGIEGDVVRDRARARKVHRGIIWASVLTVVPMATWLALHGSMASFVPLLAVICAVVAYSVPGLRFKERPFLDSFTSAVHFAGPLVYALVLTGAGLTARGIWPIWVAFLAWGMASHAFGAVQDVRADREGVIASIGTVMGARVTVWFALVMYVAASALLLLLPWPGVLAAALPLAYAASVARFARITDENCEDANRGWRTFLWLNQPVGFLVTMLLIVSVKRWL
ncbi:prenyltransferase [Demequina lutea]|uniref:4-hydroxybenzoate polyprenyltransferase n=1 Tax=Demequina lutea TaxID=431489 RepID=A0A7Y9Z7E5_9MICO|nr:prenyltransferase [Demequina lutea]NYI39981.1 4-hydroxybenzoate polyprenyltransferase [Demequina lutea]